MSLTSKIAGLTLHNNFDSRSFDNIADTELQAPGYEPTKFSGKAAQISQVMDALDDTGLIPEALIEHETKWFYEQLGIEDTFFATESVQAIASHILALYSSKVDAFARGVKASDAVGTSFHHKRVAEDGSHAVFFATGPEALQFEHEIDDFFLDKPADNSKGAYRLESFASTLPNGDTLRCDFVYRCDFSTVPTTTDASIDSVSDATFAKIATPHTKVLYSEVLRQLESTDGPVVKHFAIASTGEERIIIGYRRNSSSRYNSALSTLADYYGVTLKRKYVENFSNGYSILSMYIEHSDEYGPEDIIYQIAKEASLLYCVPNNLFHDQFALGSMSVQECIYAHCGVIFVTHFLNRLGPEYSQLKKLLLSSTSEDPKNLELVSRLKERLTSETYSQSYILECLENNIGIVRRLYRHFVDTHYISSSLEKTLSYQRVAKIQTISSDAQFDELIAEDCATNEGYALVLKALYAFNKSVLKTNFFVTSKLAISFRLNPSFLPKEEYPNTPFGMFFVVGSNFRGFHIRFRDIARGGIRIVKSGSLDAYSKNRRTMFDENYGLASTQQRKNKDIPEGGSKGVILLDVGKAQSKPKECFAKYIDALLDLLLKDPSKEKIVDLYGKPEMLFMGPDENTATFVDWATLHAKKRGAKLGFPWKAFFTGKSPSLGGIPHDHYGMTTLSVRAYVEGTYEKLGITDWSTVNKLQMAGGDGDLGSNEIKLSGNEKYVGLVDGFGVIVDEDGIDKQELLRLAEDRLGNDHFDRSKLGPKGYMVMVDDRDVTLPNGQFVQNGLLFRNNFHLELQKIYPRQDFVKLFVPCGGRPASINANNVHFLLDEKTGKSIIPIIVEGANLFITQAAKIILEQSGAILFKDASTNKGGVTSSSMEVLAALAFDDEGFTEHMRIDEKTHEAPDFYKSYVKEVQQIVVRNAKAEFNLLWQLKEETGKTFSELSDQLSVAINTLADELSSSKELWEDDITFRNEVLADAVPQLLLKTLGIEKILKQIPEAYLKAMFATKLSSEFVYTRGIDTNPAKFLEYISSLKRKFAAKNL
ncbi:DEKNAAC102936 [Brettanomyces naardenensis]|uniref:NAD-specific glutamate dehydrogenase n=1 Tax=Brettanomyces naardenensis TaxID=13370 RepID=A0A448YLY7_BRENA|nr:DEKNAAC102936 [Brettanomyces naardenensis]